MKKTFGILLFVICLNVLSLQTANARPIEISAETQSEDCKNVNNVEVRLCYRGNQAWVRVTNYNPYRVEVSYTIRATDGVRDWTVDSGTLIVSAHDKGGNAPYRDGTWIKTQENLSYYLNVAQPQHCSF